MWIKDSPKKKDWQTDLELYTKIRLPKQLKALVYYEGENL
jgi:hypothetical protein